jgi:hypothetical protein
MKGLNMTDVDSFQLVLRLRTFFKLISQISWDIAQIERRYPLEAASEEELASLVKAYREYLKMLDTALIEQKGLDK